MRHAWLAALILAALPAQAETLKLASVGVSAGVGSTSLVFGGGVEHPFGPYEAQGYGFYQRGWKTVSSTSFHQFSGKARGIRWLTDSVGVTGGLRTQHGWTHSYSKTQVEWEAGGVVKVPALDMRLYASYIQQFANGINSKGVETNRLKGFEIAPEMEMWKWHGIKSRLGISFQVFHGFDQGSPTCDGSYGGLVTCPRSSWWSHGAGAVWSFEFGGGNRK